MSFYCLNSHCVSRKSADCSFFEGGRSESNAHLLHSSVSFMSFHRNVNAYFRVCFSKNRSAQPVSQNRTNLLLLHCNYIYRYRKGDIVLFTAVKTVKSKSNIPALLHLQQNKPYIFLDVASYGSFNIRPGKT